MRLLLVHNKYQVPGGEDAAFEFEASLLESAGHNVKRLVVSNDDIRGSYDKIHTALTLPWRHHGYRLVAEAISSFTPNVMHVHNTFPQLSPSIYDAAADAKIPTVQTLHNFRITCANGLLMRDGVPCELCISGSPYNAVRFRCYRDSYPGSFAVARLVAAQKREQYFSHAISRYVALCEFARSKFIRAGVPAEKITVKPNGTTDHGVRKNIGSAILFVGRLSAEKGVQTLIEAARDIDCPVRIVGEGPLRAKLESLAPANVRFLGTAPHHTVIDEMTQARCLVLPSLCYESFPMTLVEAYAVGLPVVATRLGSLDELVDHEVTGLKFAPASAAELTHALKALINDSALAERLSHGARQKYEQNFTPDRILKCLEDIYVSVAPQSA